MGKRSGSRRGQGILILPLICLKPWIRPAMRSARMVYYTKIPGLRNEYDFGERAATPLGGGPDNSICFFTRFLAAALAC
jgi:hypothetical protein